MTTPKLKRKDNILDNKSKLVIELFVLCVVVMFVLIFYPSKNILPNNEILALDRGEALYENVNPGFQVLLGDRDNPGRPEITYEMEYDSDKAITLSLREVQDVNGEKTIPSFSDNPKIVDGDEDKLLYEEVIPGIDISYQITSGKGLKEDVILKEKSQIDTFIFDLNISGVEVRYEDGVWWFYDVEEGRKLFYFVAPYMVDAHGERSDEVKIEIRGNEVTLKADKEWLNETDRVYPVTIDPSIEIVILNVHSHPQQGEDWTVDFNTVGTADLSIIPADQATIDDDEFTGLYCGDDEVTPQILENDVIFYQDWECDTTAKVVHYTQKAGDHVLRFEYGGVIEFAYNSPDVTTYNFVGVTTSTNDYYAYEKYGAATFTGPDDTGDGEATDTDYGNISSENDVRWATTGAATDGHYDSQMYKFYITEDEAIVSQLDLKISGYGETQSGYTTDFYIWDYNTSAWELLDSEDFTSTVDIDLTDVISSNVGNYIDVDGEVTLMVKSEKWDATSCASTTIDNCSCTGSSYCELDVSGDTVYVDCENDICWSPTAGSTYAWGGWGIDEPTDSCVGIADRPACNYCDDLNYAGKTDWVLPERMILQSLCNSNSCSGTCFGGEGTTSSHYLSSTEYFGSGTAYTISFGGSCGAFINSKLNDWYYVRCVR